MRWSRTETRTTDIADARRTDSRRRTASERTEFARALGLETVPLCATCKDMLYVWAKTDPRSEASKPLWTDFVRHFVECRTCMVMQETDAIAA